MIGLVLVLAMPTTHEENIGPVGSESETRSEDRASYEEDPCIECHSGSDVMPAVIEDWASSKHANNNVSCIDCHEGEESDPDTFRHNGYWVT
ncbi:MAG: hypothetical protein GWN39_16860, partial [Thermoplasmata archaeon]|nr:hypothetical protein [Thermoplasmata archaeon]